MTDTAYAKPIPEPSEESQPYWDAIREHRLILQTCASCGTIRHYPRPLCSECFSLEYTWTEAAGTGTVYSWIEAHHPFHPGFKGDVPYVLATVELAEGVRMVGPLRGVEAEAVRMGLPVKVEFEDAAPEVTLPVFRAVSG